MSSERRRNHVPLIPSGFKIAKPLFGEKKPERPVEKPVEKPKLNAEKKDYKKMIDNLFKKYSRESINKLVTEKVLPKREFVKREVIDIIDVDEILEKMNIQEPTDDKTVVMRDQNDREPRKYKDDEAEIKDDNKPVKKEN